MLVEGTPDHQEPQCRARMNWWRINITGPVTNIKGGYRNDFITYNITSRLLHSHMEWLYLLQIKKGWKIETISYHITLRVDCYLLTWEGFIKSIVIDSIDIFWNSIMLICFNCPELLTASSLAPCDGTQWRMALINRSGFIDIFIKKENNS